MTAVLTVPVLDEDTDTLSAALAYAAAGWFVVPVQRGTKHPGSVLGNGWNYQSTRDSRVITAWFAGTDHGVALHAGRSGAVIFDVDNSDRLPAALRDAVTAAGVPFQSTRANDPERGHYVFRQPADRIIGNGTGSLGGSWGEVRGHNGVIVAAPSEHEKASGGGQYRWLRTGPVPELPAHLAQDLADATESVVAASDAAVTKFLAEHTRNDHPGLLEQVCSGFTARVDAGGSRHDAAISRLSFALKESKAGQYPASVAVDRLRTLFEDSLAVTPGRARAGEWESLLAWCVAQAVLDDPVARRADTEKRLANNRTTLSTVDMGTHDASAASPAPNPAASPADPSPDLLARVRNGTWLQDQDFPPLTYTVPGLIAEGVTLLVAPPKAGKSWFVLGIGLAVASGRNALDTIPLDGKRPVFYLALEDGDRRLQERCRVLLGEEPIPAGFEYLTAVDPGMVLHTIVAWLQQRSSDETPLIILDTLGKVLPPATPGESAYQRDYRIGSTLKRIADRHAGTALIVVHHDRKAVSDDFVDSVSGTHGLAGSADTVAVLVRPRGDNNGLLKVTGRDITEAEYALTSDSGAGWTLPGGLDGAATEANTRRAVLGLGDRSADVVAIVAAHPDGVGPTEVGAKLGLDRGTTGTYLARLARAGRIVKIARGRYALPRSHVDSVASVEKAGQGMLTHTRPLSTVSKPTHRALYGVSTLSTHPPESGDALTSENYTCDTVDTVGETDLTESQPWPTRTPSPDDD